MKNAGLGLLRRTDLHQCIEKNTEQSHLRNFLFWGIGISIALYMLVASVRFIGPMSSNDVDQNMLVDWPRKILRLYR